MKKRHGICATVCALTAFSALAAKADQFPDKPKLPQAVAVFWCGTANNCEITCTIGGVERKFTDLNAARVQTYPGSDKLWLETSLGPNSIILLGDALCDFSKMPISRPLN
jgi:hypothetical protein